MKQGTIVISAVNFVEGGPLSILHDCLACASATLSAEYDIVALVHNERLLDIPWINYRGFPASKRSWAARLYYEYVQFQKISRELKPLLWLSLHDITPNVSAATRAVYCHNPAPFYRLSLQDAILDPGFALFNLFYRQLYRINIEKNDYIVVQQQWMRQQFQRSFGRLNVVVAHPSNNGASSPDVAGPLARARAPLRLLYPTFPRVFKNVEILGEAARILEDAGRKDVEFLVTIKGDENRYASHIAKRFRDRPSLKLIGRQSRQQVFGLYEQVDALVFPSKLETWGMPLTEFKAFNKPILAADLPYAHETLGSYEKKKFFSPADPEDLAAASAALADRQLVFDAHDRSPASSAAVEGWEELFSVLLGARPAIRELAHVR
jgi:glycosyltransferase involved in cell wall biosynthesis